MIFGILSADDNSGSQNEEDTGRRPRFRRLRDLLSDDGRRHRTLFAAGLGVLGIVTAMAYFAGRRQELPFDVSTTVRLQNIHFQPFADLMSAVSLPGYFPGNVVTVTAGSLLVARWLGRRDGLFLAGLTATQGLTNHTLKTIVGRPRPTEPLVEVLRPHTGKSLPSGHVMFYTVFFGFLFFLMWTRMRRSPARTFLLIVAGALVLLVGASRVYLGAHWVSDVVAGYLVSLIILLAGIEIYVKYIAGPPARRLPDGG